MSFLISLLIIYVGAFAAQRTGLTGNKSISLKATLLTTTRALLLGITITLLDILIYILDGSNLSFRFIEKYFYNSGTFILHCFILSSIIFLVISKIGNSRPTIFAVASGFTAYILNSSGFGRLIELSISIGYFDFDWFLNNLLDVFDRLDQPWFIGGMVIYTVAASAFLLTAFSPKNSRTINSNPSSNSGGRAVAFKNSSNEPLRLIAGLAAVGRLPGQSSLEEEVNHPVQATPYPIDIDRNAVLKIVKSRREETLQRSFLYTGFGVVGFFITVGTESPLGIIIAVFAAMILFFRTLQKDKYEIAPKFNPENFDESKIQASGESDQNFVVYAGHDPFLNFGSVFGSWILSVDKLRPKAGNELSGGPTSVTNPKLSDIQKRICASLYGSGLTEKNIRNLYFAQGKNVPYQVKQPGPHRPRNRLQTDHIKDFLLRADSPVREYLWVRKVSWGHEMSTSYFLRLVEEGDDINLEITGVLMPPIADAHRWIDKIPPSGFRQFMGDLIVSIFGGIGLTIWSPIYLFNLFQIGLSKIFTDPEKAIRRSVEQQPDYDFGAAAGLRRQMADFGAISYFQNSDRRMAETAFTGRILRAYIDALDDCNIDTSELREQRATLLNQGIIVQGGDLKAKNVVAGFGAKISNVTSRISGSRNGSNLE